MHLARVLSTAGHEVHVVTFSGPASRPSDDAYTLTELPFFAGSRFGALRRYATAVKRLSGLFRRERPDIVQVLTGVDGLTIATALLLSAKGPPALVKFSGELVWETQVTSIVAKGGDFPSPREVLGYSFKTRVLALIERWALSRYTCIWATSHFQEKVLIEDLALPAAKVRRLPNLVSVPAARPRTFSSDPVTVLAMARFARWKRLDLVVQAVAAIDEPRLSLCVVGGEDDDVDRELRELVLKLDLADRTEFAGPVVGEARFDYLTRADIFVSPSIYEPFGIALVEAMAMGVPVIAAAVGGVPDVVPHREAGLLVPPNDVTSLIAALRSLASSPELRQKLSEAARQHAQRFDLERNLSQLERLYDSTIAITVGGRDRPRD